MKFAIIIYTDATLLDALPEGQFDAKVRNGRQTVMDGPFAETKEMLAGFNLIEAEDMDEAVRIATHFPCAQTGCVEVRAVQDIEAVRQRVNRSAQQASVTP